MLCSSYQLKAESRGFIGHSFDFHRDPLVCCSPQLSLPAPPAQPSCVPSTLPLQRLITLQTQARSLTSGPLHLPLLCMEAPPCSPRWDALSGFGLESLTWVAASPAVLSPPSQLMPPGSSLTSALVCSPHPTRAGSPSRRPTLVLLLTQGLAQSKYPISIHRADTFHPASALSQGGRAVTSHGNILRLGAGWMVSAQQQQKPAGQGEPTFCGGRGRETVQPGPLSPQTPAAPLFTPSLVLSFHVHWSLVQVYIFIICCAYSIDFFDHNS